MKTHIVIHGLDQLRHKLDDMAKKTGHGLDEPMKKALLFVHQRVPPESSVPRPGPGEWAAKTSPAQKRAFFAQLRKQGGWRHRTNNIVRGITTEVRTITRGVTGLIGTNSDRAGFVISKERIAGQGPQALFHRDRWFTLQDVVEKSQDGVIAIFKDWIQGLVQ